VRGFAETLADEQLPDELQRQFAAAILSNTRRMQRIVGDLLDLSRIESGSWTPTRRTSASRLSPPRRSPQ
jgi:signal transduction histidine kinase